MEIKDFEVINDVIYIKPWRINVIRAHEEMAKDGWIPYLAPLGYLNKKLNNGKSIVIKDPLRFDSARKMWDMLLSGKYTAGQVVKIANNELGLKIARSSIYVIFRNPFYYGYFKYPKKSNIWYRGKHEPMITKEEFNLVQGYFERVNNKD